jgi:hypothetical protein
MTPSVTTRLKGELNSRSWGRYALNECIPREMDCENFSMYAAINFGTPSARAFVDKDSGPS